MKLKMKKMVTIMRPLEKPARTNKGGFTSIIILFLSINCFHAMAQRSLNDSTNLGIYKALIETFSNEEHRRIIVPQKTQISDLKGFDFKSPEHYLLKGNKFYLRSDSCWNNFLNDIDTSQILESVLNTKDMETIPFVKIIPTKDFNSKKYLKSQSKTFGILELSPVILSPDKKKAICARRLLKSYDSYGSYIYFLEFKESKWEIVFKIMLMIS